MSVAHPRESVITGTGIVSPIGIGREAFWDSLCAGRSGVRTIPLLQAIHFPVSFGADLADFDGKLYVRPRKSLKVMSREMQTGFAAAELAFADAHLVQGAVAPERFGVTFGSEMLYADLEELETVYRRCVVDGKFRHERWGRQILADLYPLWMLKYLPNMVGCHVSIAHEACGPNNSIVLGDASSLLAVAEAAAAIERGVADVMLAGGTGSRLELTPLIFHRDLLHSHRDHDPQGACRPFDAGRDGMVNGEGAGAIVLEAREFAERRGATIIARVLGFGRSFGARGTPEYGAAIRRSIEQALRSAKLLPGDIGHVNAHGLSSKEEDIAEATAIRQVLGNTPVVAYKGHFGNLGAGGGMIELAASALSFTTGILPPTRNYETPDARCPVNVVTQEPLRPARPVAIALNQSLTGQAVAVVIAAP